MYDPRQIHIDAALSNVSIAYKNHSFVAEVLFPPIKVMKRSDKFFKYGKENLKRVETQRAPGTESNEVNQAISNDSYLIEEHALKTIVTDQERENADQAIKPDIDAVELTTDILLLRLEYDIASILTNTTLMSQNDTLSGTTQWSDYTNSVPLTDILAGKASVRGRIGREATHIILAGDVAEKLALHPDIKDLRKYWDDKLLTEANLPPFIAGLKVVEAKPIHNTAYEGLTASMSYIWGKTAIIAYINPKPGLKQLSLGYTFRLKGYRQTGKWRVPERKGDMVEVTDAYDFKLIDAEAGYLIADAIA